MADLSPLAGLHVAPPYDSSKELDPNQVKAVVAPFDVEKLEYFQKRQERRTWFARVTLLSALAFLLGLDIWIGTVHHEVAMAEVNQARTEQVLNIDQARLAQVELQEMTESQLDALSSQIEALQSQLDAQNASVTEAAALTASE